MGSDLKWSKEWPQAEGWYWVRQKSYSPYIVEILQDSDFAALSGVETLLAKAQFIGSAHEFYGPITPPTDPEDKQ